MQCFGTDRCDFSGTNPHMNFPHKGTSNIKSKYIVTKKDNLFMKAAITDRRCMNVCAQSKQMQHLNRTVTKCWNELTSLDQNPRRITIQIQRIYLETMFPLGSKAMHTVEIERLFDCITLFMAAIISKCEPTLPQFQCYAKYPHINCII